ncbi:hypothetical protein DL764_003716 [Monosporascus ibericus]|uniref:3'-5' exonuclease domain-containing protein n=1 Tax=Monosporascus ibericus TaxID=155417 RepID=A0A4V1XBA2_9PEZI|nr:hypothetical protein DL764_003716 [Monosporascus ibericus]
MVAPPRPKIQTWDPLLGVSFSPALRLTEPPAQATLLLNTRAVTTNSYVVESDAAAYQPPLAELAGRRRRTPEPQSRERHVSTNSSATTAEKASDRAETEQKAAESGHPPAVLNFEMDQEMFHAAKNATPEALESYWSYTQYRGPSLDGKPAKVKVHYCRSKHTMERVCKQYFMDEKILGFDLEWAFDCNKSHGIRRNVSLVQLASPSRIALFHIALFPENEGFVAPSFKKIMEDPCVTKVGVAIKGDATRVRNWMGIDTKGLMELSHLYRLVTFSATRQYENINRKLVPLATQVKEFLGLPLFKGQNVRSSDWTKPLSMQQITYSASDAYAGLHLFATLDYHRKKLDPCPPMPYHAEFNLPIRLAEDVELDSNDEPAEASEEALASTTSGNYVASVLESIKIEDVDPPEEKRKTRRTKATAKQPPPEKHPLVEAAEDRAACYRNAHPDARASLAELKAYYLWHSHDLTPKEVARLLRDPPLQESTVVGYILNALTREKLAYNRDKVKYELASAMAILHPKKRSLIAVVLKEEGDLVELPPNEEA